LIIKYKKFSAKRKWKKWGQRKWGKVGANHEL